MKNFERLRDLREDNDLTQAEIAKILGTTPQKVSEYENGNLVMKIDKYIKLAKYYNVSLDYITGLIDTPQPLEQGKTVQLVGLDPKQQALLTAYKAHPDMQKAVDKILDIQEGKPNRK